MFDTMTLTKAGGALCGALLIYLLGVWAAESLYHTGGGHGGHGEGDVHQAYVIEVEGAEDEGGAAEEEEIDLVALLAEADVAKGEKVFGKCKACHKLEDGANSTGPHLYNIVDRATGSVDGFGYSGALVAVTPSWDTEALNAFLENPKGYAPGTKMAFAGLKKLSDRVNLIAYLAAGGS